MFKVAVDTKEIRGLSRALVRKGGDMSEAMTEIAGIMLDAVEENFEEEGRLWRLEGVPSASRKSIASTAS